MQRHGERLIKTKFGIYGTPMLARRAPLTHPSTRSSIRILVRQLAVTPRRSRSMLSITDTAGQHAYQVIAPTYARKSLACLLVYSVTNYDSFESVEDWEAYLESKISRQLSLLKVLTCKFEVVSKNCFMNVNLIFAKKGRRFLRFNRKKKSMLST